MLLRNWLALKYIIHTWINITTRQICQALLLLWISMTGMQTIIIDGTMTTEKNNLIK